jgi:hypothetical protein
MRHQTRSGHPRRSGIAIAGALAAVVAIGGIGALVLSDPESPPAGSPAAAPETAIDGAEAVTDPAPPRSAAEVGASRSLAPPGGTAEPGTTRGLSIDGQAQSYSPYCQVPSGGICTVTPPQPVGAPCQCGGEAGRIVP